MDTQDTSVRYPVSRLALALPAMPDREYQALREDIRENGQQRPIAVLHGEILDGRHRLKACDELGIEPKYVFLPPETDPLKYCLSENRHRRHLNASQSAIAAARAYLLSQQDSVDEGDTSPESAKLQIGPLTQVEAATMFGVRQRTFSHAISLLTSAPTESLVQAVEQGHITVSDAAKVIDQPEDVVEAAVELVSAGACRTVVRAVKQVVMERTKRVEAENQRLESWLSPRGTATLCNCGISDLISRVDRESVDTIIGHVPQGDGAAKTLRGLQDFIAHALKDYGLAVLLCRTNDLPEAFRHLRHKDFGFVCEFDYRIDLPARPLGEGHEIALRRMPLLVFGKSKSALGEGDDVIQLPPVNDGSAEVRISERHAAGAELITVRFAVSGGLVCDPLLIGGANTALAAIRYGSRFVGGCPDQQRFEYVRNRIASECGREVYGEGTKQ